MAQATRQQTQDADDFIAGAYAAAAGGATLSNVDPATGRPIGTVPRSQADDVARAVQAARDARPRGRTP